MTPATIIREAQAAGVKLALSPAGNIKVTGDGAAVNRWLAAIRGHKAEIVDVLKVGCGPVDVACSPEAAHAEMPDRQPGAITAEPIAPTARQSSAPMPTNDELAVQVWLSHIEETDPATIAEIVKQCQHDADARAYFVGRAAANNMQGHRGNAAFDGDLRTCMQCANLIARRCLAAKRGEIVASRTYQPIRDMLRRCEGYAPGADDPDRRHGRERWPGLIQKDSE